MTKCMLALIHFFSKYQCAFRQGHNSLNGLLPIIEKLRAVVENSQIGGAVLTNLSKLFDCIGHALLIAKFTTCDFSYECLKFIRC